MSHDVFVSYSNKDKPVADAVVAGLEHKGIRCWVAPRDIAPGSSWGEAIISAIEGSRFMVIILSGNSNRSKQVVREVERAVANSVIIIPFRIENIDPTGAMAYFLSTEHWLDAITPPLERHIEKLVTTLQRFMSGEGESNVGSISTPITKSAVPARRWKPIWIGSLIIVAAIFIVTASLIIPRLLPDTPQSSTMGIELLTTTTLQLKPTSTQSPTTEPAFHQIGSFPTSREARNVFVLNNTAYIANAEDGLLIIDVSDPSDPQEIGAYPLENTQNVVVVDDIAYVVEQGLVKDATALKDRLVLLAVMNPSIPQMLGEYTPEGDFTHQTLSNMAVSDQMVYLTANDRLIIVDVSVPSQPATSGEYSIFSNISSPGVAVADSIAYLQANQLDVIDVHDPSASTEIGGFDTGWGSGIVIQDHIAYIAGWNSGMSILDISNPARPIKLGQFQELVGNYDLIPSGSATRQTLLDIAVNGDIAYLTYNFGVDNGTWTQVLESGVIAVDVSDPANPWKIAVYPDLDAASSITAVGDLVFVTDSSRGLFIFSEPQ
ncbi:MAG: hypothetical protein C3F13_17980 [Anaerolineales bacterium]|nr:TIR domain-containing protein [Anaerolineae bacterium]PWB49881.1 MAG: hypothetical protein C3F13_17980 [Anaerolineales bacterium]